MANTVNISFRCPVAMLPNLPAPGNGRSEFIVRTLAEKLAQKKPVEWTPTTERGRKLAALLAAGKRERGPSMTEAEVERELRERRGGVQ